MQYQFLDIHFPGWEVVRKLGQGSFGGVYEIQRTLPDGQVEKAALKKLSVPRDSGEIEEFRSQSFSMESITAHYKDQMSDLVREYSLMQELSSCKNIVACHDVQYTRQSNGIGWDVYIRMELLKPLKQVLPVNYSETTVLKLGLSLCNALRACQKCNIIHRDIKPENILVSSDGVFKLGDFGIAKISEKTTVGTLTGTAGYMAPEVANRWNYGPASDIYSLGMVLYWAMNERTLPFLPLPPQIPTGLQRQDAIDRRYAGEIFPPPKNGSRELKAIVMKACAFEPEDRYQSAQAMYQDLASCNQSGQKEAWNACGPNDSQETTLTEDNASTMHSTCQYSDKQNHRRVWVIPAIVLCVALAFGGYALGRRKTASSTEMSKTDNPTIEATNNDAATASAERAKNSHVRSQQTLVAGRRHTVGLRNDGTVVAAGDNYNGQCDVNDWKDIVAIATGDLHTVGLCSNGTVVAAGNNYNGQCNAGAWKDIIAIAAGNFHTVGLRSDGTVVATGLNDYGQCNVSDWKDIVAIAAGYVHTVGLRSDGTVVATGLNDYGQCNVSNWKDIRLPQ